MLFRELLRSRGAGLVAGGVTVALGMGAVAALAFGSSSSAPLRFGDPTLSLGNSTLGSAMVASSGATSNPGPAAASAVAASGEASARAASGGIRGAEGAKTAAVGSPASSPAERRGSAEVYRTMLTSPGPLESSLGTYASAERNGRAISRGVAAGAVAGGVGGAAASGMIGTNRPTVGNPLAADARRGVPAGGNQAAVRGGGNANSGQSNRPTIGTSPVGPATSPGAGTVASNTPSTGNAGMPAAPTVIPPSSSGGNSNAATSPAPVVNTPNGPGAPSWAGTPGAAAPGHVTGLATNDPKPPTNGLGGLSGSGEGGPAAPGSEGGSGNAPGASTSVAPPPTTAAVIVTPEPATWLMMLSGLVGLALVERRRSARKRAASR